MRLAPRQDFEDLRCDAEVGPTSDLQNGPTREMRTASFVNSSRVVSVESVVTDEYFYTCDFMIGLTWQSSFQLIQVELQERLLPLIIKLIKYSSEIRVGKYEKSWLRVVTKLLTDKFYKAN